MNRPGRIEQGHRDSALGDWLNGKRDAGGPPDGFTPSGPFGIPTRDIGGNLTEWLLRFPSAPIYGLNRLIEHQVVLPEGWHTHFHTYRVLGKRPNGLGGGYSGRATRVHLLHHGLNERDDLGFFYRFAEDLIADDDNALCVIRPFPGHLTRYPFSGPFSETPLDRYLVDAGDLFRQFLRFMSETRWFLSVIAPVTEYRVMSGLGLLCSPPDDRADEEHVVEAIASDWLAMAEASAVAEEARHETRRPDGGEKESWRAKTEPPSDLPGLIRDSVRSLRSLVGVEPRRLRIDTTTSRADADELVAGASPEIHVFGYSLGGFMAQSIFFAWPFLIGSCSTLLSGGALRNLRPTAFANPEEWQTVLHALRYELDHAATLATEATRGLSRGPAAEPETGPATAGGSSRGSSSKGDEVLTKREALRSAAGLDPTVYEAFVRIFYEVFEQEFGPAYRSRCTEFSRRLLFVVGGSDVIVETKSVLDAAPKDVGINLLQIANLSHFVGGRSDGVEQEQRDYWLPEIAGVVARFAKEGDRARRAEVVEGWLDESLEAPVHDLLTALEHKDRNPINWLKSTDLVSKTFEEVLDQLVWRVCTSGTLIIAENTVPIILMPPRVQRERAGALHHSDGQIIKFLAGALRRSDLLEHRIRDVGTSQKPGRWEVLAVLVPARFPKWYVHRSGWHPSRSETIPGYLPSDGDPRAGLADDLRQTWATWRDVLVPFEATAGLDPTHEGGLGGRGYQFARAVSRSPSLDGIGVTSLPNVWLWIDEFDNRGMGISVAEGFAKWLRTCHERAVDEWSRLARRIVEEEVSRKSAKKATRMLEDVASQVCTEVWEDGRDQPGRDRLSWLLEECGWSRGPAEAGRVEERLVDLASRRGYRRAMAAHLTKQAHRGKLACVRVSGAYFNPRFRGALIVDGDALVEQVAHLALCFELRGEWGGPWGPET